MNWIQQWTATATTSTNHWKNDYRNIQSKFLLGVRVGRPLASPESQSTSWCASHHWSCNASCIAPPPAEWSPHHTAPALNPRSSAQERSPWSWGLTSIVAIKFATSTTLHLHDSSWMAHLHSPRVSRTANDFSAVSPTSRIRIKKQGNKENKVEVCELRDTQRVHTKKRENPAELDLVNVHHVAFAIFTGIGSLLQEPQMTQIKYSTHWFWLCSSGINHQKPETTENGRKL